MSDREHDDYGVLYGGPDIPLIEADCQSLGELVLRKLAESGDSELVVSIFDNVLITNDVLGAYGMCSVPVVFVYVNTILSIWFLEHETIGFCVLIVYGRFVCNYL